MIVTSEALKSSAFHSCRFYLQSQKEKKANPEGGFSTGKPKYSTPTYRNLIFVLNLPLKCLSTQPLKFVRT